jgi:hypothetical protein
LIGRICELRTMIGAAPWRSERTSGSIAFSQSAAGPARSILFVFIFTF